MFSRSYRGPSPDADVAEEPITKTKLSMLAPAPEEPLSVMGVTIPEGVEDAAGYAVGVKFRECQTRIEELEDRLKEYELTAKREDGGVWQAGKEYNKGAVVTCNGAGWIARVAWPHKKPGTPESGWRLFEKSKRNDR